MTKLEELINELCPDGVEYKTVGEVCTIKKGAQLNRDKLKDNGLYPVVNGGVNPSGYWDEYNFNANLITISQGGASAGYVNFMTTPFWAGAHCYVVEKCEECLNYTYLYHFIKMHQKTFMQCQYGAGIPSLSLKSINAIGIPLPPLSIQSEIVHILDSFTLLTAELTAELTARQKQYAFYRDYLLDFSDEDVTKKTPDIDCSNVEYIKLKDVCKIGDGLHSTPIYDNNGSYYFINGNNLENGRITFTENTKRINISQYERYKIELDDATILMSINGTIGKIALYNREPIILGKSVAYFNVNERILKKYLYYLLQTNRSNAYYEKNLTG